MKKRVLAMLLVLALAAALLPVAALADGSLPSADESGRITLTEHVTVLSSSTFTGLFTNGVSSITIDLQGYTLTYSGGFVTLKDGQSLTFTDSTATGSAVSGTLNAGTLVANGVQGANSAFNPETGARVVAKDIYVKSTGSIFYPKGNAAEVRINNCDVYTTGAYCVATNAATVDNYGVEINLEGSVLKAEANGGDDCTVMINVTGTLDVNNCIITGDRQAVLVRAGTATIANSDLTVTGDYVSGKGGTDVWSNQPNWGSGNEVPSSALIVGSYYVSDAQAYKDEAIVTVTNTEITSSSDSVPAVYVDGNSTYEGDLTITGESTVTGTVKKGKHTATPEKVDINIVSGAFSEPVESSYLAENTTAYASVANSAGTTYYVGQSVQAAAASAPSGSTVTVLQGSVSLNPDSGVTVVNSGADTVYIDGRALLAGASYTVPYPLPTHDDLLIIRLPDGSNQPVQVLITLDRILSGPFGGHQFEDGMATLSIAPGQTLYIHQLPVGTNYTISLLDGTVVSGSALTGTILPGVDAVASFTALPGVTPDLPGGEIVEGEEEIVEPGEEEGDLAEGTEETPPEETEEIPEEGVEEVPEEGEDLPEEPVDVPQTGDAAPAAGLAILLGLAVCALALKKVRAK